MNRKDLQALSVVRLKESEALLRLRLYDGAYYLAGYAVECGLKACIAKATRRGDFPDLQKVQRSYTHDLDKLVKMAGLDDAFTQHAFQDAHFGENWDVVKLWSEETRYKRISLEVAEDLVRAISEREHGVMSWIKKRW